MDNQTNNNEPVYSKPNYFYNSYNPQMITVPPKKEYSPLAKRDGIFGAIFLLCSFLFTDFALFNLFHLGFTISYLIIFTVSTAYLWDKAKPVNLFSIICGLISLAGSVTLSLFSNPLVNFFMLVMIAGLYTIYCIGISKTFNNKQGSFKTLIDLMLGAFVNPFIDLGELFGSLKAGIKKGSKNLSALIGILLAFPVILIIVPLLIKSDAAFEGLVSNAVVNKEIYLLEFLVALILIPFIFSFAFGKRYKLNLKNSKGKTSVKRGFNVSGSVSFLSVIALVYVVYLFSQLAYFFSAFKGILPEGYTKSASVFARRGFFEMFAIVAINIIVISVVNAFTKRKNGKASGAVKGVSLFISLFSVLLLATAMQKMMLNIETYGYSRNRLLVSAFMVMMLVVISFFILHIFVPKAPYMQTIIIVCSVIFVVLSFADINALTANYNTEAYINGKLKSINVEYLAELGDSSVPSLIKLTKNENKKTAARAEFALVKYAAENKGFRIDKKTLVKNKTDFRVYVKVRENSENAVVEYFNSLTPEQKPDFISKFNYIKKHEFKYDNENGYYYCWEDDTGYKYNSKSGKFELVRNINNELE